MSPLLRFNAPPHHTLVEAGEEIAGGSKFEVSEERALELLTDPHMDITEAEPEPQDRTKQQLRAVADGLGLAVPSKATKAELQAAVEAAEAVATGDEGPEEVRLPAGAEITPPEDEPEADGEGHTTTEEED